MRKILLAAVALSAFGSWSLPAVAWDDAGHKIVADIAARYLLPSTKDKIRDLLAADTDASAPRDLESAAVWASPPTPATADWHFLHARAGRPDIPAACYGQPALPRNTPASQGPARACIVDKINQFTRELGDAAVPVKERAAALKYLTHLIADIHQPLRVVDEGNDHGRGLLVSGAGMSPGDLFGFWDSVVVSRVSQNETPERVAESLVYRVSPALEHQWATRTPQLWALEAYQLGVDRGYGMVRVYDDQGRVLLQEPQVEQAVDVAALQLSRAGVRLAHVLNTALNPSAPAPVQNAGAGNAAAGRDFASKVCKNCHVLGTSQAVDTMAPDFSAIANTDGISAAALTEFLQGPHPTMPNIKLTRKQADDLASYILGMRKAR